MKVLKWVGLGLLVVLVVIQAFRPAHTNPPVDPQQTVQAALTVPADVDAVLERSCNDCHSNETLWPWYAEVAPVSWFVVDHVNHGREEMSFSAWGTYSARKAAHKLEEICEKVREGEMPLASYLLLHPEARLSEADKQALCDWAQVERARMGTVEAARLAR